MGKSKFILEEPDDDDLAFFSKEYTNAGILNQEIEKLEDNIPDKRTKEFQKWKDKINFLIDIYNRIGGFKAYKKY